MGWVKKAGAVIALGMCIGMTASAFTATSATARFSYCNHHIDALQGDLAAADAASGGRMNDNLANKLAQEKADAGC